MTIGIRLLELAEEYRASKASRDPGWSGYGEPVGRAPEAIAADYETAVLALVQQRAA